MKTNTQKYPAYKDSGVEWLGEIPSHWDLTRLGTRFEERKTKVSDKDFPPLSVTKNGTIPQLDSAAKSNDGDNRKLVKTGDFVINSRSDRKGSSGIAYQDGSVSLIYIVMEPKGIHSIYCNYLLKSYNFIEEFYRMGHGIVADLWTTRYDEMKAIMVGIPSLEEQTAIADFLDRKTALIDQAIGIKHKQIDLLKERRQILIHKAVTRGLNPNVKMKESGVEWIGEIPEHWTITLLKRFCHKITDGSHHSPQTQFEGRNYISVKDVDSDGNINLINCKKINEKDFKELVRNGSQPKINDILLTKDGTIGRAAIVDKNNDFVALSSLGIITPDLKLVLPQYLSLYLTSEINVSQMFSLIAGSALTRLTIEKINNLITIIPPLNEQFNIINYVKPLVNKIATAISLKEQEIEKLKEYKATLINSAVTGKIKVS